MNDYSEDHLLDYLIRCAEDAYFAQEVEHRAQLEHERQMREAEAEAEHLREMEHERLMEQIRRLDGDSLQRLSKAVRSSLNALGSDPSGGQNRLRRSVSRYAAPARPVRRAERRAR